MDKHAHQNVKPNWPLALIQKALEAIKIEVSSTEAGT